LDYEPGYSKSVDHGGRTKLCYDSAAYPWTPLRMTFAQPHWFWALGLLPLLLALFYRNEQVRQELIEKFVAPRLAKSLAGTVSIFKRRLRSF
jgi:hypothetical protein